MFSGRLILINPSFIRFVVRLLQVVKNQFLELQKHNVASAKTVEDYRDIMSFVSQEKEVAWADDNSSQFAGDIKNVQFSNLLQNKVSPRKGSKQNLTPSKYCISNIGLRNAVSESVAEQAMKRKNEDIPDDQVATNIALTDNTYRSPKRPKAYQMTPLPAKRIKMSPDLSNKIADAEIQNCMSQGIIGSDSEHDHNTSDRESVNVSFLVNDMAGIAVVSPITVKNPEPKTDDLDSTFTIGSDNDDDTKKETKQAKETKEVIVKSKPNTGMPERVPNLKHSSSQSKGNINTPHKPVSHSRALTGTLVATKPSKGYIINFI